MILSSIACNAATPGRLNDLVMNEIIDLKSVTYLVSEYTCIALVL